MCRKWMFKRMSTKGGIKLDYLYGVPVHESEYALKREEKQAKKHRQKRINKKWRKRYGVITKEIPCIYKTSFAIVIHPKIKEQVKHLFISLEG